DRGLLVTVCDGDALGKTFEDGDISLEVTEDFYGGRTVDGDAVVESLERATIANLVGVECVELAIEAGYVDEDNVLEVGATRHAQLLRL
ncbi:MAG: DUF424 domain-containing protein, partial [Halobacteriaceae archaeon]